MEPDYSPTSFPPGTGGPPPTPPEEAAGTPEEEGNGYPEDCSRDRILRDLKDKLQENQKQTDRLKKLTDKLQTDVEALQKSSQEIDSVVDGYRKDYRKIRSDVGTLRCWFDQKHTEVSDTIPPRDREEVERKRDEVDGYITALDETVQALAERDAVILKEGPNDSVQYAEVQVTNASSGPGGADDEAKVYDLLKSFPKQALDDVKKLDGWKKGIEDAIAKPDLRVAWFLLLDFEALLADLERRIDENPPNSLSEKLDRAWCELVDARRALREAEAERNDRTFALETKKKSLEEARKTRRERILEAIGRS